MNTLRPSKTFRIAMIPTANAGVNYYRLAAYAFEMRKYRNVEVSLFSFQYDMNEVHPWQKDFESNPHVRAGIESLCEMADIVIWQPTHYGNTLDFFLEMQHKYQKPMLVEMDDNYVDVPEWSEAFNSFQANSNYRRAAVTQMKYADGMIVSTPYLRDVYSQFNERISIVPNSLDFKGDSKFVGWDKVSVRKHKGTRIGWIAGRAHFNDLMMVAPAIKEVLLRHPEVTFCLVNSALKPSCEYLGKPFPFEGLKNIHYADRSVPINRYAKFMASLGFDIGIAPLVDCNFNRSKSNLRWLEYSALHLPTVATSISNFKESIQHGQTGFLIHDNDLQKWVEALEYLISDDVSRETIGNNAYKQVKKYFSVKNNAPRYIRHLKEIVNQPLAGDLQELSDEFSIAVGV